MAAPRASSRGVGGGAAAQQAGDVRPRASRGGCYEQQRERQRRLEVQRWTSNAALDAAEANTCCGPAASESCRGCDEQKWPPAASDGRHGVSGQRLRAQPGPSPNKASIQPTISRREAAAPRHLAAPRQRSTARRGSSWSRRGRAQHGALACRQQARTRRSRPEQRRLIRGACPPECVRGARLRDPPERARAQRSERGRFLQAKPLRRHPHLVLGMAESSASAFGTHPTRGHRERHPRPTRHGALTLAAQTPKPVSSGGRYAPAQAQCASLCAQQRHDVLRWRRCRPGAASEDARRRHRQAGRDARDARAGREEAKRRAPRALGVAQSGTGEEAVRLA
jgi:hypothetical protein